MTSATAFRSIGNQISDQMVRTPGAAAILEGTRRVSYRELDEISGGIASRLQQLGIGRGRIVALRVERSVELVAGIVAILRAGAAYLPIDPDTPPARIVELLELSQACAILTDVTMDLSPSIHVLAIGDQFVGSARTPGEAAVTPDDAVSIFFTSGSTGRPKGVVSSQVGWLNRMQWMQARYALRPDQRVLHKTTISFDDSAVELLWPLMVGGTVAILPPGLHREPRAILDAAVAYGVRVLHFVPSMLALFVDALVADDVQRLAALDVVISSGEALHLDLVERFAARLPDCGLFNQWGATEASIDTTWYRCDPAEIRRFGQVPLGKPIDNNRVYVLDDAGRAVTNGGMGELFIAGVGVGLGYLGDKQRTDEAFVADPFHPGERMYKTGDLAKVAHGHIFFVGRQDSQVKIRGNRVELLEIEARLSECEAVATCAVTTVGSGGDKKIVALVKPVRRVSAETLQQFLRDRLPSYMVPARIVFVDELPKTASGKIDRRLVETIGDRPNLVTPYRRPARGLEQEVAAIIGDVLRLDGIGADDQFLSLGGNSLDAMRVASRLMATFGTRIAVNDILQNASASDLSNRVRASQGLGFPGAETAGEREIAFSIRAANAQGVRRMSNAEQRLAFLHHLAASHRIGALLAYRVEGALRPDLLREAFVAIMQRHAALRTRFVEDNGQLLASVVSGLDPDVAVIDASSLSETELGVTINDFYNQTYDLGNAPLWRVRLYRTEIEQWLLVLSIHPIITDGWSNAVLTAEIGEIYAKLVNGQSSGNFPDAPAATYEDYSEWIEANKDGPYLARQGQYWSRALPDKVPSITWPRVDSSSDLRSAGADVCLFDLGGERSRHLREFCLREGVTAYLFLLTIIEMFIYRTTGEGRIAICTPMAGRVHPTLETVVGPLVNPVVVYCDLTSAGGYQTTLQRLRAAVGGAYENQTYPFDLVLKERRDRNLSGPLYSTVFVVQNYEVELELEGASARDVFIDTQLRNPGPIEDVASEIVLHAEVFERGDSLSFRVRFRQSQLSHIDVDAYMRAWVGMIDLITADPRRAWNDIDEPIKATGLQIKDARQVALTDDLLDRLFG